MSGPTVPGGRGEWWARRARAVLGRDARSQRGGVGLLARARLRAALVAVLAIEPADVLPDAGYADLTARASLDAAWSVVLEVRTRVGRILTGTVDPAVYGAERDADRRTGPAGGSSKTAGGSGGYGRFAALPGEPPVSGRPGDGARLPTVSVGTGPVYLVTDRAGTILGHSDEWSRAHDLAHLYADGSPLDLPIRVVNTATLTFWATWGEWCYRPDPATGMPTPDYTCPRPPSAVDHRPSRRFFGRTGLLTVPFLGGTDTDPESTRDELTAGIANCHALLAEIGQKTVHLAAASSVGGGLETALHRGYLATMADGLSRIAAELESLAHDE